MKEREEEKVKEMRKKEEEHVKEISKGRETGKRDQWKVGKEK